ncbi:unnamed protein product [Cuscuta epithymum]|uniref:LXG domain-containing protein n=1 Tax=Cuscuta epithymum TaxID=186058 RepID=A0AAV0E6G0_9ASTE|nr:unnamed protein product [Cuscuta epithymum]
MAAVDIVYLKEGNLRRLADLIREQEIQNMYYMNFSSVAEQVQYLTMCNNNAASVRTLLDECLALAAKYRSSNDAVRGRISDQTLVYAEHCLNNALQLFRNFTLRRDYLDKMLDHFTQIFQAVEDLNTGSSPEVSDLSETIQEYDQMIVSYIRLNVNTHASQEYSQFLANSGVEFRDLVRTHKAKLGFTGRFEDLEEDEKLAVYTSVLEESGRLRALDGSKAAAEASSISYWHGGRKKKFKFGSAAMFLMDMGQIVWDVYSSGEPLTTALREALVFAAEAGGAALGKLVATAAATHLLGAKASATFVAAAGIVGGIVGAFIAGAVAGLLFGLIFNSGGEAPLPTDGFVLYVVPMPNGRDLAPLLN